MYLFIKRASDIVLSLIGLIILSPILLIISIAIKMESKGPVLFRQIRVGNHKTNFNILKFRTMTIDTPNDVATHLLANPAQYMTKTGTLLRKHSVDELPQLLNILAGQMSLIGPRPCLPSQVDLIEEREKYGANDVPVGLTGWAQINGRDELPIEVKAKLDGEYVKRMGIIFDIKCFCCTIARVLKCDGIVEGRDEIIEGEDEMAQVVNARELKELAKTK